MPFSISFYNNQIKKLILPDNSVICNLTIPAPGKEYIVEGYTPLTSPFTVTKIYNKKKLTFSVKNIIFRDYKTNFCKISGIILSYQDGNELPPSENISLSGYFYNIYKDSVYECEGFWSTERKGNSYFKLTAYSQIKNSSISIIEEYLINTLKGLSVGPITIKKITSEFGYDTLEKIKERAPELEKIIKNPTKRASIVARLIDQEEREKALEYLVEWGIPVSVIMNIIENNGAATYGLIKANPNVLFDSQGISPKTIDRMSQDIKLPFNDTKRIIGFIKKYLYDKERINGDIYVELSEFYNKNEEDSFNDSLFALYVLKLGNYIEKLNNKDIKQALDILNIQGYIVFEPHLINSSQICVYRKYYNYAENGIINRLKDLKSSICSCYIDDSFIDNNILSIESKGFKMDNKQKLAVKMALQNNFSIISGGPGTGKTQTTKTIVDTFIKKYPTKTIQLCAPTGKASRRMSEVINLPASTIHKKLNCIPFSDVEMKNIEADLLIIDEVSMMDVDLFFKVLTHISDETSILLVGDYNQLPSVGPGLILRDLIDCGRIPNVLLTTVFRQNKGSKIIDAAYNVLNNKPELIEKRKPDDFLFYDTVTEIETHSRIVDYILKLLNSGVSEDLIQVITPANNGSLGVNGLNITLREILNPNGKSKGEIYISPTRSFYVGDRVIQTKNNYDLDVFNGSIGKIISIDSSKETAVIEFDGIKIDYSRKDIMDIKLGYAITVHKSQGSEFDYVLMPIVYDHEFINNKNLLYTAITRAKKRFFLIGQIQALINTCDKTEHFSRKSQIKDKLCV